MPHLVLFDRGDGLLAPAGIQPGKFSPQDRCVLGMAFISALVLASVGI